MIKEATLWGLMRAASFEELSVSSQLLQIAKGWVLNFDVNPKFTPLV